MAYNKRKRLLIGAAGLVGLLIVALLTLPLLIDVNAYKPEIAAQVKRATGRDAAIRNHFDRRHETLRPHGLALRACHSIFSI